MFNFVLGIQNYEPDRYTLVTRQAVRAVIFNDGKLLMIHTNRGDYKFPGGGVDEGEDFATALKREVSEESGYELMSAGEKLGVVTQRNIDIKNENGVFEMYSHYFLCGITDKLDDQQLDDYEREQEFSPVWISVSDAISANEAVFNSGSGVINSWVERELLVLRYMSEGNRTSENKTITTD